MPMYDYRCTVGHQFEALRTIADRENATCPCGASGQREMLNPPRIDPRADLPSMRALWRRKAEERGRGKDMTAANRTVDEDTHRRAHSVRAARGENPTIVS